MDTALFVAAGSGVVGSASRNPRPWAKAQEFRCYHCGEVFTTDEECREHFGDKQVAIPRCRNFERKLIALVKAGVQIAILRHNLIGDEELGEMNPPDRDHIAEDVANVVRGYDTCSDQPAPEWMALVPKRRGRKSRITHADKVEIRRRYLQGEKWAALAAAFGITEGYLRLILKGIINRNAKPKRGRSA